MDINKVSKRFLLRMRNLTKSQKEREKQQKRKLKKYQKYQNITRKKMRLENKEQKFCTICEGAIPIAKNKNAKYCSEKCIMRGYWGRNKERRGTYRQLVIEFLGGICSIKDCEIKENLHVDHILPIMNGGKNIIKNIQLLCIPHHKKKTKTERLNPVSA